MEGDSVLDVSTAIQLILLAVLSLVPVLLLRRLHHQHPDSWLLVQLKRLSGGDPFQAAEAPGADEKVSASSPLAHMPTGAAVENEAEEDEGEEELAAEALEGGMWRREDKWVGGGVPQLVNRLDGGGRGWGSEKMD